MEIRFRRRRALSTVLALFLAVESVAAVAAAGQAAGPADAGVRHELPAAAPAGDVLSEQGTGDAPVAPIAARVVTAAGQTRPDERDTAAAGAPRKQAPDLAPVPDRAPRAAAPTIKPPPTPKPVKAAAASGGSKQAGTTAYKGRNHVWIPSLGINRAVYSFPCSRSREPDNYVYRWGCAGANNVYLLGHAHSVFKPLHDAYVAGRLKVGMKAWYADSRGKVHLYKVKWWKITRPTTDAKWAWAAQSVPSMTLQTCVGRNSEYRLMVRLVEVR